MGRQQQLLAVALLVTREVYPHFTLLLVLISHVLEVASDSIAPHNMPSLFVEYLLPISASVVGFCFACCIGTVVCMRHATIRQSMWLLCTASFTLCTLHVLKLLAHVHELIESFSILGLRCLP